MSRPTLEPSDKARLTAIEDQLHNLARGRPASAGSFRDLSDVFAIPIGHGDLLVYSRTMGGLTKLPVGPRRQVLTVDPDVPLGVKWGWLSVGAPGFDRIELHDHDAEGFMHFYSPLASETFHGNLYQDTIGAGGSAQSRVVLATSEHNNGWAGLIELLSQSVDGSIPASVRINGTEVGAPISPANSVVTEFDSGQSSSSGASSLYSRGDHTHGTPFIPQAGNTIVNEFTFGQSSFSGTSALFSRVDHTHGTPVNPVLTNHPRFLNADTINVNTTQVRMQAGNTVMGTDANGNGTITYGVAFPTATLFVVVTNGDGNAHANTVFSLFGYVAGSFGVHCHIAHTDAPLAGVNIRIHWIAVGY